ncbi:hypothetical protein D3C85_1533370 [compost metagenome]
MSRSRSCLLPGLCEPQTLMWDPIQDVHPLAMSLALQDQIQLFAYFQRQTLGHISSLDTQSLCLPREHKISIPYLYSSQMQFRGSLPVLSQQIK